MQIVIDIPDRIFKMVCNNHRMGVIDCDVIHEAIANGTPLPKGHGDLIDADKLDVGEAYDEYGHLIGYRFLTRYELDNAPIIIEADKPESEE